jgi:uncharacterized protein
MDYREKSEIRDGMRIDWDMPIRMEDGLVLRCDIYRPVTEGKYPVIMTLGPYGKWLHFEDLYKSQWDRMCADQPDVPTDSTNKYQCWEVVDPEKWVPDGYVCIRVDSRGAGRSPGVIDIWSLREAKDLAQCVDWAGVQPWSNGKVGLNGISYYAQNQWETSALQPKHLAAICTWEGAADFYRDMAHHGGIFNRGFVQDWSKAQVYSVQNGRGARGFKSRMNGDWVSGPETMSEEQLGRNRRDFYEDCISRKLDTDPYWQSRMPDWTKVKTPLLSSADRGCIRAAISRASCAPPPSRNGWRCTASNTGRISIRTTGSTFRNGSSATFSRAKTPAGPSSRRCCCRCAIPARNSLRGMKASGRSRARSGRSSTCSRRT